MARTEGERLSASQQGPQTRRKIIYRPRKTEARQRVGLIRGEKRRDKQIDGTGINESGKRWKKEEEKEEEGEMAEAKGWRAFN